MSVFRRGQIWWYEFHFRGQRIRETTSSTSKTLAERAERQRRHEIEEGVNHLKRRNRPLLFNLAAKNYLEENKPNWSESNYRIESYNVEHLKEFFGQMLLTDISGSDISRYQSHRLAAKAARRTCNLEIGTLRAILRKQRLWGNIQPDIKMLKITNQVGQALDADQEERLLQECAKSRSRSLYPAVTLALSTGMRYSEIRLLTWKQLDFAKRSITVGASKTEAGAGRVVTMNNRAFQVLTMWSETFPNRHTSHYVFGAERYGADGTGKIIVHGMDPTKPIGDFKEGWEAAKKRAGIRCRFHDMRHTACTRMLESGVPFAAVAKILGWSDSSAVRMAQRYGHIRNRIQEEAVTALDGPVFSVPTISPTENTTVQ